MRTLVTGFSSFPGVADNVTERFVRHARTRGGLPADTRAVVLPVSYDIVARRLPHLLAASAPDLFIALGADTRGARIRLESFAHNVADPFRADATGRSPTARISEHAPQRLATRLPLADVAAEAARRGLDAEVSRDAGRYVCNFLYFKLLERAGDAGAVSVFIHLPQSADAAPGFDDVRALIDIVVEHHVRG